MKVFFDKLLLKINGDYEKSFNSTDEVAEFIEQRKSKTATALWQSAIAGFVSLCIFIGAVVCVADLGGFFDDEESKITYISDVKNDSEDEEESNENGLLVGYVEDENNSKSIENAVVTAINLGTDKKYTAETDEDGKFKISLPEGKYNLECTALNYKDFALTGKNDKIAVTIKIKKGRTTELAEEIKLQKTDVDYSEVINQYKQAVKKDFYYDVLEDSNKDINDYKGKYVSENVLHHAMFSRKFGVYYAMIDINNDGISELVIGAGEEAEYLGEYDIFTYNDNKVVPLFPVGTFYERSYHTIYDNGVIQHDGSGGAAYHSVNFYKLPTDTDKVEFIKGFTIEEGLYYESNSDGERNQRISEGDYNSQYKELTSNKVKYKWKLIGEKKDKTKEGVAFVQRGDYLNLTGTLKKKNESGKERYILKLDKKLELNYYESYDQHDAEYFYATQIECEFTYLSDVKTLVGKKVSLTGNINKASKGDSYLTDFVLLSCQGESLESETMTKPATTKPTTTKPSKSGLSEKQIQRRLIEANNLYMGWCGNAFAPELDMSDTITFNGNEYARVKSGEFSTVNELESALSNYFDESIYRDYVDGYYTMKDNKMYANIYIGQGGDIYSDKNKLTVNSNTENECCFNVVGYNNEYGEVCDDDYVLTKRNGKWIFTTFIANFGLYYNNESEWI